MTTTFTVLGIWFGLSFVLAVVVGRVLYDHGTRLDEMSREALLLKGQIDALTAADEYHQRNVLSINNKVAELARERRNEYGQWN